MLLQCIFRNVIPPQHYNSGLCPDTIFAFLTAQNCELNASKISLYVQLAVLSVFVMLFIYNKLHELWHCGVNFHAEKTLHFVRKGPLLQCNCSSFTSQKGHSCIAIVVLLECKEALNGESAGHCHLKNA